jgi:hypothetical protein
LAVSTDQRRGGGVLNIRYRNVEQLDDVVRQLEQRH